MKKVIIACISILIPAIIPIVWEIVNSDHKELTIEERKNTPIDSLYGNSFSIYYLDSIKVNNKYSVIEYRIINTGNTTIVGYGDWSDILTESNRLPITNGETSDLRFIQLTNNDIAELDKQNRLTFKQWRPKEYIDLICLSTNDSIININDRDIKDVQIIHKKLNDKITNFEELSLSTKWVQVGSYLLTIISIIMYLAPDFKHIVKDALETSHNKMLLILGFVAWLICIFYTLSLPLRWLL